MVVSRLKRYEDRTQRRRLILSLGGIVAILVFFLIFGIPVLEGFSLLIDKLRGGSAPRQESQTILLAPTLDPVPEATNSALVAVGGRGQAKTTAILYLNDKEAKRITVDEEGTFHVAALEANVGDNTLSAKLTDERGNLSELSNVLTFTVIKDKPILELTSPQDNTTITGDQNTVMVGGKTQEENQVTVNGRLVPVRNGGVFQYAYPLSEGGNILSVVATDQAGNQTTIERRVTYQR